MNTFRVEYLINFAKKDSFCNNIESLKNLLKAIDGTNFTDINIEYQSLKLGYEFQTGVISKDNHSFFHLKFICNKENQLNEFNKFLRQVREILSKIAGVPPQVLWDDIGFYYARQAYPLIYEIENIMRKLITKFMSVNVGLAWANENTPQEVNNSIRNKSQLSLQNYLFEIDFIQLSNFLFKKYTTPNNNCIEKIAQAKDLSDLDLSELHGLVPLSNWERYFNKIVDCESDFLIKRWDKLYELRNHIAHNKPLSKNQFEQIEKLVRELRLKLQKAIDNLDKIDMSEEERDKVAESSANLSNLSTNEFAIHLNYSMLDIINSLINPSENETRTQLAKKAAKELIKLHNIEGRIGSESSLQLAIKEAERLSKFFKTQANNGVQFQSKFYL